jgi:hypothetical protein
MVLVGTDDSKKIALIPRSTMKSASAAHFRRARLRVDGNALSPLTSKP